MKDHICMKNIRAKMFQFTNPVLPVNNQLMDRGGAFDHNSRNGSGASISKEKCPLGWAFDEN